MGKWPLLCKQSNGFVVGQTADIELLQTVYTTEIRVLCKLDKKSY